MEDGRLDEKLLNEVVQRLTRIEVKLEEIVTLKRDVHDNRRELETLTQRVIELETKDEQQRKELDEIRDNSRWISRAVIGALITSVVAIIFTVLKLGLGI
jgi:predicted transcriptional regulator